MISWSLSLKTAMSQIPPVMDSDAFFSGVNDTNGIKFEMDHSYDTK